MENVCTVTQIRLGEGGGGGGDTIGGGGGGVGEPRTGIIYLSLCVCVFVWERGGARFGGLGQPSRHINAKAGNYLILAWGIIVFPFVQIHLPNIDQNQSTRTLSTTQRWRPIHSHRLNYQPECAFY